MTSPANRCSSSASRCEDRVLWTLFSAGIAEVIGQRPIHWKAEIVVLADRTHDMWCRPW